MIVPVIRMVAAPLRDLVTGVNVHLAAFPLDVGDTRPEPIAAILDATRDDAVLQDPKKRRVVEWPALIVTAEVPVITTAPSVMGLKLDAPDMRVTVAHVTKDGDTAQAFVDADYALRAAAKALDVGLFAAGMEAARTRNGITILKRNSMTIEPVGAGLEGGITLTSALTLSLHVREA